MTDDLLFSMVVMQGLEDRFRLRHAGLRPQRVRGDGGRLPLHGGFLEDANLGSLGQTGRNNGNCYPNSTPTNTPSLIGAAYYPLASPAFPGYYGVSDNRHCGALIAGMPAYVSITVELATPKYTKHIHASTCTAADGTPIGPPCYTVTYEKVWSVTQSFSVWID